MHTAMHTACSEGSGAEKLSEADRRFQTHTLLLLFQIRDSRNLIIGRIKEQRRKCVENLKTGWAPHSRPETDE